MARTPTEFIEYADPDVANPGGTHIRVGNRVRLALDQLAVIAAAIAAAIAAVIADNLIPAGTGAAFEETLPVDGTVDVFASVWDASTTHVVWSVEPGGAIMATFAGVDPVGEAPGPPTTHTLYPHDRGTWTVETAQAARFIRRTTVSGSISITQMKPRV